MALARASCRLPATRTGSPRTQGQVVALRLPQDPQRVMAAFTEKKDEWPPSFLPQCFLRDFRDMAGSAMHPGSRQHILGRVWT